MRVRRGRKGRVIAVISSERHEAEPPHRVEYSSQNPCSLSTRKLGGMGEVSVSFDEDGRRFTSDGRKTGTREKERDRQTEPSSPSLRAVDRFCRIRTERKRAYL